jgi:hypothetical protein
MFCILRKGYLWVVLIALQLISLPVVAGEPDPFVVLGVPRTSSAEEIQKAYRKLVMKYHPDRTGNDRTAQEMLKEVNRAYDRLGNPNKGIPWVLPEEFRPQESQSATESGRANTGFAAAVPEEWKRRFDVCFAFAKRPFHELGLGLGIEDAKEWALKTASNFNSEADLRNYIDQYGVGFNFALKPIHSGGLGLPNVLEARNWTIDTLNNFFRSRETIQNYMTRYALALQRALTPISSGGLGYGPTVEIRNWAINTANRYPTTQSMKAYLGSLTPPSPQGQASQSSTNKSQGSEPCFVDKLKSLFKF